MRRFAVLAASVAVALIAVLASASSQAATRGRWVITDLGTLGGPHGKAMAVNNQGLIVGKAATKAKDTRGRPISHAFLWENGRMRDLGTLGGNRSEALAINERGQVVGNADTRREDTHAFLWENGKMRDLTPRGGTSSRAEDINDRGQVLLERNFLCERGKWTAIGGPSAFAINGRGQVLSSSQVWQKGSWQRLGTLPGRPAVKAVALSDRGWIVGIAGTTVAGTTGPHAWYRWYHPVLWTYKP